MSCFLDDFEEAFRKKRLDFHGIVVTQEGKELGRRFWIEDVPHELNSVTKAVVSLAVGIAIGEGKLSLEAKPLSYFPEYEKETAPNLKDVTLRHLLTMTSGRRTTALGGIWPQVPDNDWIRHCFAAPCEDKPGSCFLYDGACTHLAAATLQRAVGENLSDYMQPRFFDPLGIRRPRWDRDPMGYNCGPAGLHLRTGDLSKIGNMILQGGRWEGRQLVPEDYIRLASSKLVDTDRPDTEIDHAQGYGLAFWRCRHGAFRADGYNGQYIIVLPEKKAVIATNGCSFGYADTKMQASIDTIWETILPVL